MGPGNRSSFAAVVEYGDPCLLTVSERDPGVYGLPTPGEGRQVAVTACRPSRFYHGWIMRAVAAERLGPSRYDPWYSATTKRVWSPVVHGRRPLNADPLGGRVDQLSNRDRYSRYALISASGVFVVFVVGWAVLLSINVAQAFLGREAVEPLRGQVAIVGGILITLAGFLSGIPLILAMLATLSKQYGRRLVFAWALSGTIAIYWYGGLFVAYLALQVRST